MKTSPFLRPLLASATALALLAAPSAFASDIINWTGGTNATWSTAANWNSGAGPAPTNSLTGNRTQFNLATYSFAPTATNNTSISGIIFGASNGGLTLSTGTNTNRLNVGSEGIVMNSGSGAVIIGSGATQGLKLGATQTWMNNSANLLTVRAITNSGNATAFTLTLNGSGTGGFMLNGVISDGGTTGTTGLNVNMGNANGAVTLNGANTFSGGLELSAGILNITNAKALGNGTFTISGTASKIDNTSTAAITNSGNNVMAWNGNFTFTGTKDLNLGIGAVTMNASRTVTTTAGTLTVGGVISGAAGAGLTKAGSNGALVLGGANTYNGTTTITQGALVLNNVSSLAGGIGATGGLGALTFNGNANTVAVLGLGADNFYRPLTAAGVAGGVNFTGAGGWAAYGANRTVLLGNSNAAPVVWAAANTGFNGQALILGSTTSDFTVDLQNDLDLGAVDRLVSTPTGSVNKISGIVSGTGGLLKTGGAGTTGGGTLILSGINTFSGPSGFATSGAGILQVSSDSNLGTGTTIQIFQNDQFHTLADMATNKNVLLGGAGNTNQDIRPLDGTTFTINGIISDKVAGATGLVRKNGTTGTLELNGTNTFGEGLAVQTGTLKAGNSSALGFGGLQTTVAAATTVTSGATLDLNGTTGINEPIVLNGIGMGGVGALINNSASPAVIENGIATLTVAATGSGSGYSSAPTVVISGGGGSGATAAATAASLGVTKESFTLTSGGTGWAVGNTFEVLDAAITGRGSIFTVTSVLAGAVTGFDLTAAGVNFTGAPTTATRISTGNGGTGLTITGNSGNFTVGGFAMTNAGSGYTSAPTITLNGVAQSATATFSSVNLATASSIGGSGDITIKAVVSGTALTKVGAGTLTLSGVNTFTGNTTINGGAVVVSADSGLGAAPGSATAGHLVLNDGALATTANMTLNSNRGISVGGTTGGQLNVAASTTLIYGGNATGAGGLEKAGTGTLVLSAANAYTGGTLVSAGTMLVDVGGSIVGGVTVTGGELKVNGSIGSGTLSVSNGAILSGTGTIAGATTISGAHNPGNSPGIQTFSSNLAYTGGSSVVNWELKDNTTIVGTNPTANFDQIVVNGDLDFTNPTTMNITMVPFANGGIVDWSNPFWSADRLGTSGWLVYDVTGTTTNLNNLSLNYAGLVDSNGAFFTAAKPGASFAISQQGNDVYLTYTAVPEPAAWILAAFGLTTAVVFRRRRRE